MKRLLLGYVAVACLALPAHANRNEPGPGHFDQLADAKRQPNQPRKLVVTDTTECILDGKRIAAEAFMEAIEASPVTIIGMDVSVDGVTLIKLVGETKVKAKVNP